MNKAMLGGAVAAVLLAAVALTAVQVYAQSPAPQRSAADDIARYRELLQDGNPAEILTEKQMKDVVALLLDQESPVNK